MNAARIALESMAYAHGKPSFSAIFKREPMDFCVDEILGFEFTGSGEHLCVQIRKTAVSTPQVLRSLARAAGIREADIGFAGLKDRQGICTQWFSLYMPVPKNIDFTEFPGAGMEILQVMRNSRKIRRGSHRCNRFRIKLRETSSACGTSEDTESSWLARLALIRSEGVPNYFGEQRFGNSNSNIVMARQMFAGEFRLAKGFKRGMLLSAARSFVFNEVLSRRVSQNNWNAYLEGDVMNLAGSDSVFIPPSWDAVLQDRLQRLDIHPTGPLSGKGEARTFGKTLALEMAVADEFNEICAGLAQAGLLHARRSLRLPVEGLQWRLNAHKELDLEFSLPPGAYATSVLRELCFLKDSQAGCSAVADTDVMAEAAGNVIARATETEAEDE